MKTKKEKSKYYANMRRERKSINELVNEIHFSKKDSTYSYKDLTPFNAFNLMEGKSDSFVLK